MKKTIYLFGVCLLCMSLQCGRCSLDYEEGVVDILFAKNQQGQVLVNYEYKNSNCDDYQPKERTVILNENDSYKPTSFGDYEDHFNKNKLTNQGKEKVIFVAGYYEFRYRDYMLKQLPIKHEGKVYDCSIFKRYTSDKKDPICDLEEHQQKLMEIYKNSGYKGYVELAPNESHSFKKEDFFVEREGKEYEWHQWTRDSILKSWAEK